MTRFQSVSLLVWTSLAALTAACGAATSPSVTGPGGTVEPSSGTSTVTSAAGEAAVWDLGLDPGLERSSTRFTALVSRLGCNSGVTGQVLTPVIEMGKSEIIVTFSVAPKQPGGADCLGNDQVSYEVELGEPLRERALIDGQCLAGGEAVTTSFCVTGPTRFKP
jgi:hypothetical protein